MPNTVTNKQLMEELRGIAEALHPSDSGQDHTSPTISVFKRLGAMEQQSAQLMATQAEQTATQGALVKAVDKLTEKIEGINAALHDRIDEVKQRNETRIGPFLTITFAGLSLVFLIVAGFFSLTTRPMEENDARMRARMDYHEREEGHPKMAERVKWMKALFDEKIEHLKTKVEALRQTNAVAHAGIESKMAEAAGDRYRRAEALANNEGFNRRLTQQEGLVDRILEILALTQRDKSKRKED